jgi:hypothetical protein
MKIPNKILTLLVAATFLHATTIHAALAQRSNPETLEDAFSILHAQLNKLQRTANQIATPPEPSWRQKLTSFATTYVFSQLGASIAQELIPVIRRSSARLFMTKHEQSIAALNARMGRLSMNIAQKDLAIERYKERLRKCPEESPERGLILSGLKATEDSYFEANERLITLEKQKDSLLKRSS